MRTSRDSAAPPETPVIAALDMGYGHLRAAASIASVCGGTIVEADRPPIASESEMLAWRRARRGYEVLSRAAYAWYAPGARRILDAITDIPLHGAPGEHAAPNFAARSLHRMIGRGLGAGLAAHLRASPGPLVATFYAPAIAAEVHGADRVHLVVTDSDVNRVWAPHDPSSSRVNYLAPTAGAAARLVSYGVPPDRVRVTGFPLPPALIGDDGSRLRRDVAARLARLDPCGAFDGPRRGEIEERLREPVGGPAGPPTVVFAVGGAGAQVGTARRILTALREPLAQGRLRLVLVAGTRPEVARRFERWIAQAHAAASVRVVFEPAFAAYDTAFNESLAAADVLWTKPSELTFYAALGLPLLLARPLGVHERRNRDWASGLGAAIQATDAAATAARLPSLLADGSLAAAAWAGFTQMPQLGARRIVEAVAES